MKKVMFVCSAGMSTSMLVQRVQKAADAQNFESKIWAVSDSDAKNHLSDVDCVLLGPQVRFLLSKYKKEADAKGFKVDVVDQIAYGRMDGEAVLKQVLKLLG